MISSASLAAFSVQPRPVSTHAQQTAPVGGIRPATGAPQSTQPPPNPLSRRGSLLDISA